MEQRPLRLGDIVDDYCPRERRITNHAIVAVVEQTIRQTRCTTCDTEHVYKDGKAPRRLGRKDGALTDLSGGQLKTPRSPTTPDGEEPPAPMAAAAPAPAVESTAAAPEPPTESTGTVDGWLAHRPLIRATLPRSESDPPTPRPIPEFTMHQRPSGRNGRPFRFGGQNGWQDNNGNRQPQHNGHRHGPGGNGNFDRQGNGDGQPGAGGANAGRHRRPRHRRPR